MKGSLVSFTEAWEAKEHGWARCQNVTRRDGGLQVPGLRSAPTTISSAEPAVTAVAEEGLRCDTWYWRAFLNRPVTTSCPFPAHALNLVVRRETGPHRRVLPVWHLKILWVLFIHVFAPVFLLWRENLFAYMSSSESGYTFCSWILIQVNTMGQRWNPAQSTEGQAGRWWMDWDGNCE